MYRIFHGKHRIFLSSSEDKMNKLNPDFVLKKPKDEEILEVLRVSKRSTKPLKIFMIGNPKRLLKKVFLEFEYVEAAGGVVRDHKGRLLLIKRSGKWDLPKGKAKRNEDMELCAIREVEEETGAKQLTIVELFTETYHTYYRSGKWQIKHTFWYLMDCADGKHLVPQTEEEIEEVRWVHPHKIYLPLIDTYPAIRRILKDYKQSINISRL